MADYKFMESTGLVIPDTVDLKTTVENEYREAFGQDLVIIPESPEGLLIAAETESRDAVARNNAELANQINPDFAGGVFLDAIAALTGLERRQAEPSLVPGQLSGVPGTIILAGAEAGTEVDGVVRDIFHTKDNVILDNRGTAKVWFYSNILDAIPCPVNSLTRIVTPVLGWETVNNAKPATLGQPVEKDAIFRKRRKDTLFLQGVALPGAIMSAVMDVPGVRSMVFRENYDSVPKVIDGVTIPPHTIYTVIDGGTDEDVAHALFANKSLGCGWLGEVSVEVTDKVSGQTYLVRFSRPKDVPVRARVTVRAMGSSAVDYRGGVVDAIMAYANDQLDDMRGFVVGAPVSPFEMSAAIGMQNSGLFVVNLVVGPFAATAAGLQPETMPLEIWQKAVITPASIDVVGG
jgi:hypothetical protein